LESDSVVDRGGVEIQRGKKIATTPKKKEKWKRKKKGERNWVGKACGGNQSTGRGECRKVHEREQKNQRTQS